jgi:hypothetical protein
VRPIKKLQRGDIVWWIHYDKWASLGAQSAGELVTFIRAEVFEIRTHEKGYPDTYIMKPIKVYFDKWFSAEDNIPTLGVQVPRYQLFTDKELNYFQDKHGLIEALFFYRWD